LISPGDDLQPSRGAATVYCNGRVSVRLPVCLSVLKVKRRGVASGDGQLTEEFQLNHTVFQNGHLLFFIYIFIHRLGRKKHARKQTTREIDKETQKKILI